MNPAEKSKKMTVILLCSAMLTACTSSGADLGIIGGTDGPTSITVASQNDDSVTYYTEMPVLEGIPTPPGSFESGWKSSESGMISIQSSNVSHTSLAAYTGITLIEAGFTKTSSETDEKDTESYLYEDDRYTVSLFFEKNTLVLTATEK